MAHPAYVVDIAFRQFLYYWQCGLQPSLYLDTNSDGTVFACSKVTGGQAYSETQVSRKPGRRSGRSSRRRRRKRHADSRDQTIQNATSTESFHENTFPHDYSGEEGSKELVTDDSQTFTLSDSQNFQPTFRNTIDDDGDTCTASDLIKLDMDPAFTQDLEADHVKSRNSSDKFFPILRPSPTDTATCSRESGRTRESRSDKDCQDSNDQVGSANPIPIEVAMLELLKHINAKW